MESKKVNYINGIDEQASGVPETETSFYFPVTLDFCNY